MFGFFKRLFGGVDSVAESVASELEKQDRQWRQMSSEELSALSDVSLIAAAESRTRALTEAADFSAEKDFSLPQRVFYTAHLYAAEMENGGLCQFLVNYGREHAAFLPEALHALGAQAHAEALVGFLHEQEISPERIAALSISNEGDYEKLEKSYPFDHYNAIFETLPRMEALLASYIKAHIAAF